MAPSPLQQRRTHNTLLFQKLLNLRDGASPFTLVLDTLEQSGLPVVREFARRAKISKSKIVFISFSTLRKRVSLDVNVLIPATELSLSKLRTEILSQISQPQTTPSTAPQKTLLIIDTLNPLSSNALTSSHLPTFLSSLLASPTISILATYHLDIPLPIPDSFYQTSNPTNTYAPSPLTTLTHLATAILHVLNLSHTIARKRARDRSIQEPGFGLGEGREGAIVGLRGEGGARSGAVVVEMEVRRKSGRGVRETFVLSPPPPSPLAPRPSNSSSTAVSASTTPPLGIGSIILLDEHPLYSTPSGLGSTVDGQGRDEEVETTFNLGLTEKQKRDREGVVLPYFDAQKEGGALGAGEGGRILYEMGYEDREDFDDEEDEI